MDIGWDALYLDVMEVIARKLGRKDAACLATQSRVCRQAFVNTLDPRRQRQLVLQRNGVAGRITGAQLAHVLRILCSIAKSHILHKQWRLGLEDLPAVYYVDAQGSVQPGQPFPPHLHVSLPEMKPRGAPKKTLPDCSILTHVGASFRVRGNILKHVKPKVGREPNMITISYGWVQVQADWVHDADKAWVYGICSDVMSCATWAAQQGPAG